MHQELNSISRLAQSRIFRRQLRYSLQILHRCSQVESIFGRSLLSLWYTSMIPTCSVLHHHNALETFQADSRLQYFGFIFEFVFIFKRDRALQRGWRNSRALHNFSERQPCSVRRKANCFDVRNTMMTVLEFRKLIAWNRCGSRYRETSSFGYFFP